MTDGVSGLMRDKTRPSRIPPLGTEVEQHVVARTLEDPPGETTHWTAAAMAKETGISVSSVQRIWRRHGLQPHRTRQFKLSNDPQFAAKLHEIVGLYVDPRHPGLGTARRIVGPDAWQEQSQSDRHRNLAACQGQRHQALTVGLLAESAAVLPRHPDRCRAFLWQRRVVNYQHRIIAAQQAVRFLSKHPPERAIIPGRAADKMMQLIMARKAKPNGNRLHALRSVGTEQASHVEWCPFAARAAPHHAQKRRQPRIKIATTPPRAGHSAYSTESQARTKPLRVRTSAKVVPGHRLINRIQMREAASLTSGEVVGVVLFEASCDSPEVLELVEEALDQVAVAVKPSAEDWNVYPVRHWLDVGPGTPACDSGTQNVAVVAAISEHDLAFPEGGEQVRSTAAIVGLALGQLDHDRIAVGIDHSVDFGGQATSRAPHACGNRDVPSGGWRGIPFLTLAPC